LDLFPKWLQMTRTQDASQLQSIPPAPRHIDWFTKGTVLLGGFHQQFGWAFFSMGLLFTWIFVGNSEWRDLLSWTSGPWETVSGEIVECVSIGAHENDEQIYRCYFRFSFNGVDRSGSVYYSASLQPEPGTSIEVEMATRNPSYVRVEGGRTAPFSRWVGVVMVFPLIGLSFLMLGFRSNLRYLRLLSWGQVGSGKLEAKTKTGATVTINNQSYPVYRYRFTFLHQGREVPLEIKTHLADRVEDDPMERILFDPFAPGQNALYDAIPNAPVFDSEGNCIPTSFLKSYLFILPGIGLAEILIFLLLL
jgi:hypothetical protein